MRYLINLLFFITLSCFVKADQQPNILLVYVDDMGWGDLSCFGNQRAQTPNIDRLANEGLAFHQFYVNSPICSPSRVAISTGQYPVRWGITSFLNHRKSNAERGVKDWLSLKAPMLARTLKQHGYRTGHFGKWHMGGQRDVDNAPEIKEYGFDTSLTNFEGMGPKLLPMTMKPGWTKPGRIWDKAERLGGPVIWEQRSRLTGGFAESALAFIRDSQRRKQPFYVNLWPDDVHAPFWPEVKDWSEDPNELYDAVLEGMDRQLGRIFDVIRKNKKLRDNTLVLFASDNGPHKGGGSAGPFRGYKTFLYEGGLRSPLIAWGPGLLNKTSIGTKNLRSVFSAVDLVPSLLSIAGITSTPQHYDGEDIHRTLLGFEQTSRSQPLFFNRPPDRKGYYDVENLPDLAMRKGKYKLLCDYDRSRMELYDLEADPSETKNIANSMPDLSQQMSKELLGWYQPFKKNEALK